MNKIFLTIALIVVLMPTQASASINTGTVSGITVAGNWFYLTVTGATSYAPCATPARYSVTLLDPIGRAMYAMALSAKMTNTPIYVGGSGGCGALPNTDPASETVNVFNVGG